MVGLTLKHALNITAQLGQQLTAFLWLRGKTRKPLVTPLQPDTLLVRAATNQHTTHTTVLLGQLRQVTTLDAQRAVAVAVTPLGLLRRVLGLPL